jgi:hypothetical protein
MKNSYINAEVLATVMLLAFSFIPNFTRAQDESLTTGLYGMAQTSFISIYNGEHRVQLPNQPSVGSDLNTTGSLGYGASFSAGYFLIKHRLSVGVGLGLYNFHKPGFSTLPIYGEVRFYFTDEPNIPYININLGTSPQLGNNFKRGPYGRIGVGYRFFISDDFCLLGELNWQPFGVANDNEPYNHSNDKFQFKSYAFTLGLILF